MLKTEQLLNTYIVCLVREGVGPTPKVNCVRSSCAPHCLFTPHRHSVSLPLEELLVKGLWDKSAKTRVFEGEGCLEAHDFVEVAGAAFHPLSINGDELVVKPLAKSAASIDEKTGIRVTEREAAIGEARANDALFARAALLVLYCVHAEPLVTNHLDVVPDVPQSCNNCDICVNHREVLLQNVRAMLAHKVSAYNGIFKLFAQLCVVRGTHLVKSAPERNRVLMHISELIGEEIAKLPVTFADALSEKGTETITKDETWVFLVCGRSRTQCLKGFVDVFVVECKEVLDGSDANALGACTLDVLCKMLPRMDLCAWHEDVNLIELNLRLVQEMSEPRRLVAAGSTEPRQVTLLCTVAQERETRKW